MRGNTPFFFLQTTNLISEGRTFLISAPLVEDIFTQRWRDRALSVVKCTYKCKTQKARDGERKKTPCWKLHPFSAFEPYGIWNDLAFSWKEMCVCVALLICSSSWFPRCLSRTRSIRERTFRKGRDVFKQDRGNKKGDCKSVSTLRIEFLKSQLVNLTAEKITLGFLNR